MKKLLRILLETMQAMGITEVVCLPLVLVRAGRPSWIDGHTANRIQRDLVFNLCHPCSTLQELYFRDRPFYRDCSGIAWTNFDIGHRPALVCAIVIAQQRRPFSRSERDV